MVGWKVVRRLGRARKVWRGMIVGVGMGKGREVEVGRGEEGEERVGARAPRERKGGSVGWGGVLGRVEGRKGGKQEREGDGRGRRAVNGICMGSETKVVSAQGRNAVWRQTQVR